ncbi:hypothetical protein HC761_00020 [bacterium]|nr:hypothetical protein [bacterium]
MESKYRRIKKPLLQGYLNTSSNSQEYIEFTLDFGSSPTHPLDLGVGLVALMGVTPKVTEMQVFSGPTVGTMVLRGEWRQLSTGLIGTKKSAANCFSCD